MVPSASLAPSSLVLKNMWLDVLKKIEPKLQRGQFITWFNPLLGSDFHCPIRQFHDMRYIGIIRMLQHVQERDQFVSVAIFKSSC